MIEFQKKIIEARLKPPPKFEPESQLIEYRSDPLTGIRSIINIERAGRLKQAEREEGWVDFIRGTKEGCFFCPENRERSTPLFPAEIWKEGRMRNPVYVFPNLFPFAEYHAVATLTDRHFLDLDEFTPDLIVDSLSAFKQYIAAVYRSNREAKYPLWIWNHLPPSAASLIHPHTQILVDREPSVQQKVILGKSKDYFLKNKTNYWEDLIRLERGGERWVGENDTLAIVATFAPQGAREIQFIFKTVSNLPDLNAKQINDFAETIIRVLRWYKEDGVNSFNVSSFSSGVGEKLDYYRLNAKMISRPRLKPYYSAYGGPLEIWHNEYIVETLPEEVAGRLRRFFE